MLAAAVLLAAGHAVANPADLDSSFGTGGLVLADVSPGLNDADGITDIALQPDGKIVAAGGTELTEKTWSGIGDHEIQYSLMRFNSDGSVDTGFGNNGRVLTGIAPEGYWDNLSDIELQPDGKIVAAGFSDIGMTYTSGGYVGGFRFSMARYNGDGTLDTAFGTGGTLYTEMTGYVYGRISGIVLQADGRIVAGGSALDLASGHDRFVLARYNANGTLDTSFGSGGLLSIGYASGSDDSLDDIALLPDGRILASGRLVYNGTTALEFMRFNANGTLDTTFGSGGMVASVLPGVTQPVPETLTLLADGRFVVGGSSDSDSLSLVVRYNADGTLDTTFDGDGVAAIDRTLNPEDILGMAVQADGDLVAVGRDFSVMRINTDGSLDGGFGSGGSVTTSFGPGTSYALAYSAQVQPNGAIVVGGFTYRAPGAGYTAFALARYNGTPVVVDADNDGVLDNVDQCPGTVAGTVVDGSGCAVAQYCPCAGPAPGTHWKNHGAYVSCVSHHATLFMQAGLISGAQRGAIVSAAAQSDCGK